MGIEVTLIQVAPGSYADRWARCTACHYDAKKEGRKTDIRVRLGHAVTRGVWLRLCEKCAAELRDELEKNIQARSDTAEDLARLEERIVRLWSRLDLTDEEVTDRVTALEEVKAKLEGKVSEDEHPQTDEKGSEKVSEDEHPRIDGKGSEKVSEDEHPRIDGGRK